MQATDNADTRIDGRVDGLRELNEDYDPTLRQIIQPLLDVLNVEYRAAWRGAFDIADGDQFGGSFEADHVLVSLPTPVSEHSSIVAALATLLQRSGSDAGWSKCDYEGDPMRGPLRFAVVHKTASYPEYFVHRTHLLIDYVWIKLYVDRAVRQISLLAEYLKDKTNLLELSAQELSMF